MTTTNVYELHAGRMVIFTPDGSKFQIAKVTDKRVSWYVGFEYTGGMGKNTLRMAGTSLRIFNEGIRDGGYELI